MKMKTKNQDSRLSSKTNTQDQVSVQYISLVLAASTTTKNCHIEQSHQFIPLKWNFCLSEYFYQLGVTEQQIVFVTNFVTKLALVLTIFIKHDLTA